MNDTATETTKKQEVIDALRTVFDPEIPVNIYDLGLVYDIEINEDDEVMIDMTLTSPACPVAGTMPGEVATRVNMVDWVKFTHVELVWEPQWNMEMMTEAAKLELGFM
ncbi:MAG: SUF system Fe-S cluster assembly protein [Calditrichaeota bacterium]|nr:MAG: SUF system Fe-S cluster assembly protein [Calditrichota bacterium]